MYTILGVGFVDFFISAYITMAKVLGWKTVARSIFFHISLDYSRSHNNFICFDMDETGA